MSTLSRRVTKELADLEGCTNLEVRPYDPANISHLEAALRVPSGLPYSGGTYTIDIQIPNNYPFERPVIKFNTMIWHPNIHWETGEVGPDSLGSWDPTHSIKSVLESTINLLKQPNLDFPHNHEALKMFKEDPAGFERKAREWAVKFAGAPAVENDQTRYGGYNRDLIQRFVDMGFGTEAVVEAFKYVGIDRNNGQDYTLEEAYEGDILAKLYDA